jgi:murein DD-endopeptidase MepM/ murein hydrolase activator NlpD
VYAHLAGLVLNQGDVIFPGQVLGFLGNTGSSFGPHLHFEIRVHGAPIDPLAYLAPAQQQRYAARVAS